MTRRRRTWVRATYVPRRPSRRGAASSRSAQAVRRLIWALNPWRSAALLAPRRRMIRQKARAQSGGMRKVWLPLAFIGLIACSPPPGLIRARCPPAVASRRRLSAARAPRRRRRARRRHARKVWTEVGASWCPLVGIGVTLQKPYPSSGSLQARARTRSPGSSATATRPALGVDGAGGSRSITAVRRPGKLRHRPQGVIRYKHIGTYAECATKIARCAALSGVGFFRGLALCAHTRRRRTTRRKAWPPSSDELRCGLPNQPLAAPTRRSPWNCAKIAKQRSQRGERGEVREFMVARYGDFGPLPAAPGEHRRALGRSVVCFLPGHFSLRRITRPAGAEPQLASRTQPRGELSTDRLLLAVAALAAAALLLGLRPLF